MSKDLVSELAQGLVAQGVKYAFGITGSGSSLKLIRALQGAGVAYYPVGHEAAAAFMAGACCRDGEPRAVAITIKGPGFSNMVPAMLSNSYEGRAAVTVSEAYGANTPIFRKHKRWPHQPVCANLTKAYAAVSGEQAQIDEIFSIARSECPGPVHLDLGPEPGSGVERYGSQDIEPVTAEAVERVIETIAASERPALVLGSLAGRALGAVDWNALTVPVVTTAAAKGVMDEHGDYAAGVVTGEVQGLSPEAGVLSQADLIVGVGLRNTEVVKADPYDAPLVIIDQIAGDLHEGFEAKLSLLGSDVADRFDTVFAALQAKSWGADVVAEHHKAVDAVMRSDEWQHGPVFDALQRLLPTETVLTLDTGFFCTVGETVWKAATPAAVAGSAVGRFMGSGIPTAIGASIASPGLPVLCAFGDGGFSPYLGEIELAVRERLPVIFAYFSDGRYGSVGSFAEDVPEVSRAVDVGRSERWQSVEAMGCPTAKDGDFDLLQAAIGNWEKERGPLFLQFDFEPERYAELAKKLR